jgi:hypothetical protein
LEIAIKGCFNTGSAPIKRPGGEISDAELAEGIQVEAR